MASDAEVGTANRTEQGTVRDYDPTTRSGSVFTDDGFERVFTDAALSHRIRHLRFGQRVRLTFAGDALIRLQIVTLPDD